jgi:hypothetical protein
VNKHLSWLVLGSLALSLLFNAFALREVFLQSDKLGQLQAQLTEVTNTVHSLNGRLQSIANQLSGAQAAGMWLMSSEFVADASKSSREAVSLTLQFMLQEVARDANVSVLYRPQGATEWTSVSTRRQGAQFSAVLTLDPAKAYEYQVVEEGPQIRASRASIISEWYYRPMPIQFFGGSGTSSGKRINMTLQFAQVPSLVECFRARQIEAHVYLNGELTETLPVTKAKEVPGKEQVWELELNDVVADEILLVVEYEDGYVEELKAWPDPHKLKEFAIK